VKTLRLGKIIFCAWIGLAFATPAFARTVLQPPANPFPPTPLPSELSVSDDEPVMLTADKVDYLQQQDIVIARGHVEVVQGNTLVLADEIIYERPKSIVTARGNVSVMDATGAVMFADEVELRDDLYNGVIEQFRMRLLDNSLFAAARAEKKGENILEMHKAVYSPCKVKCREELEPGEEPSAPLWQLRADSVVVDQDKQTVTYDDAVMEVYGLPVFYTPYMSHATPNADGKQGIMTPEFRRDRNLGNVYTLPYYYPIAGDKDIVLTPIYTSKEGGVLKADYHQKFDSGAWRVNSSITNPEDRDAFGDLIPGKNRIRGHFFTAGEFNEDEDTRWGFDVKRTTDDTYMRKYSIDGQTLLMSRAYGETYDFVGSSGRSALTAEGIAFQGLAVTDNSKQIPLILPLVGFNYETNPTSYGGRYFIDSNLMSLTRDMGAKSNRLSNTFGWRLPFIAAGGQVIEFETKLRGDIYDVSDVLLSNGKVYDGLTGRFVPEANMTWRYPFINQMEDGSIMFEPVVQAAISPNGGNPEKIPNEDSLVPEFTDTNLFSDNRFAGYDRIEHGPRMSYGLRGLVNYQKAYVDWLIGQHYRPQEDRNFPFSNDVTDHLSDYVGKVGIQYDPFYLAYRFRMDKEGLSHRRKEVDLNYSGKGLSFTASYLSLQNDPVFASKEEVVGSGSVDLSSNWSFGAAARRDIQLGELTNIGAMLTYKNECVNVAGVVDRQYIRDRELKPNTSYLVRVSLKNLN